MTAEGSEFVTVIALMWCAIVLIGLVAASIGDHEDFD